MGQQLKKISDHVWVYTFDSPKDRPNLGYILGRIIVIETLPGLRAGETAEHKQEVTQFWFQKRCTAN